MTLKNALSKALILISINVAQAETPYIKETPNSIPVCLNKAMYFELLQAIANKDQNQMDYVFANGCIIAKPGIPITVLDAPARSLGEGVRMAKIRLYKGKTGMEVWTAYEFVAKPE